VKNIFLKKKRLKGLSRDEGNKVYVVDTSVLIEYLDETSPFAKDIELLFNKAIQGEVVLCTTTLVVAELLYVASRLYREFNIPNPNEKAFEYITWLKEYVKLRVYDLDDKLALRIGELKKKLRIALTDCSVIALAEILNAIPLFKRVENEMKPILNELRKLGVKFLEDRLK